METNLLMIEVAHTNIQSKFKINGLLSDPFALIIGVRHGCPLSILLYIIAAEVLVIFIDVDTRIKGVEAEDCEKKIVNFKQNHFFLSDITCLTRIQVILKL